MRQGEQGTTVGGNLSQGEIGEATHYNWRKKRHGGLMLFGQGQISGGRRAVKQSCADGGGRQSIPFSSPPAAAGMMITTPFPES